MGTDAAFVAEQGDAPLVRILIRPDRLSVSATIEVEGGIDRGAIEAALAEKGVLYGLQGEAIDALCRGDRRRAVVALGLPPRSGDDTRFEQLIDPSREVGVPKVSPDGHVDYLDLGFVRSVSAGEPLMRRIPPTLGLAGRNVLGEALLAKDGHDRPFRWMGSGARLSQDDPNLLVAAVAGLPAFGPDFAQVEPVLWLPAVDAGTGHVRFAGTVIVAGDVMTGLRVEAERDVIVAGTVEAAEIVAGGDVDLRGGMAGHGTGRVTAAGTVTARYLDGVTLSAGEDLYFDETLAHCAVSVCRDVVAASSMGHGQIIGGQTRAGRAVRVRLLGAPAGPATTVVAGATDEAAVQQAQERLAMAQSRLRAGTAEVVRLRMAGLGGPLLESARFGCEQLQAEVMVALRRRAVLQPPRPQDVYVEATGGFFGGVDMTIAGQHRRLREDQPGARFILSDGHLTLAL